MRIAMYNSNQGADPPESLDTSAIEDVVLFYNNQMANHPLRQIMESSDVPHRLLKEYASLQYVDSTLWVPMLAIMKDRARSPKLLKSLRDNVLCEAGANHTSHITLCLNFVKSLGIDPFFGSMNYYSDLAIHPTEMMNAVTGMNEEQIAGWALVAESIVPHLFQMSLAAYQKVPGADVTYLTEHIHIDSAEHAQWMFESAKDLAVNEKSLADILSGIHLGGRTALSVPDALYARYLRGHYHG